MARAVSARASLRLFLTTPLIDLIPGPMRQSNGIQPSPEDTAITAGCSSQAARPPASRSSIAHVIAANGSILRVVTPKATKVKAAKIPALPAANHGQTVFLFNSIEPNSGDAILQPVLQYGPSAAGGGSFWALATWYLVGDQTFFTTPVCASARATLDGAITLTSLSGASFAYTSSLSNATETLEAYGTSASDYPTGLTSSGTSFAYTSFVGNLAGTSLSITGGALLTWSTETLEACSVTSASDYPTGLTSSGTSFAYTSSFSNVAGTSLSITGGALLTWSTETLEACSVTSASGYPTGSTVLSGINLKWSSGAVPTVAWRYGGWVNHYG
ncbi:hypothetical protein C8R44DRAFT_891201 [Mycena epipterygia]|nr:hypothetical protein C8R44DRAFT_891201 [Mycena epipterygia]